MLKRVIANREPQATVIEVGSIADYKQVVAWNGTHAGVIVYNAISEMFFIKWAGSVDSNMSNSYSGWRQLIETVISRPKLLADEHAIEFYTLK